MSLIMFAAKNLKNTTVEAVRVIITDPDNSLAPLVNFGFDPFLTHSMIKTLIVKSMHLVQWSNARLIL